MASTVKTISLHSLFSTSSCDTRGRFRYSYVTFRRRTIPTVSATTADYRTVHQSGGSNSFSLYDVLGVQDGATCKEIKDAYRRLARAVHPDVVAASKSNGCHRDTSNNVEFIRVNEAYVTLSDPGKRAEYDKTLSFKRRLITTGGQSRSYCYSNVTAPNNGTTPYSYTTRSMRRSWETDQCW